MSSHEVDSQELDFEDVIAQFERNINSSQQEGFPPEKVYSEEESEEDGVNIMMDMTGFEPDLRVLCGALMEHVQLNSRVSKKSGIRNKEGTGQAYHDSGLIKEIFRAEIKETLTHMQNFRESELEGSELLSNSERSTINSLKRQLRERDEQLATLKRKFKQAEIVKYRLEHSVDGYQATFQEYVNANEVLENEVKELRKKNAAFKKRCSDADVRHKADHYERERLHLTIAKFRQEVVVAHQNALNSRTEAKQAKKRMEHLEARAAEEKTSSEAVSARIRELKDIQDEMVATMRGIQDSGDATAARRVLKSLAEQRSRLVGKIAKLLTGNNKQDENLKQENSPTQISNGSENTGEGTLPPSNPSSSPEHNSYTPPPHSNGQNSDEGGLNKKQRFESFRKLGNDLTRMTTGRNSRRVVMANVERTCEAVERDTEALREVIELKESELERMEDQLAEAVDRVSTLEMALQMERQRKKLENRNMRNPALEKAQAEMRSYTTTRWKKSTLFEWQSQTSKTEDKTGKLSGMATVAAKRSAM